MLVTVAEVNSYLGICDEDTLVNTLIGIAQQKIFSYLGVTGLQSATYTDEKYDFNSNGPYYLKQINPTNLTQVDGTAFSGDYQLQGRELKFYLPLTCNDTTWNKITFTYVAGYEDIPEDIKSVMYELIGFLYNNRKTKGMTSFTQGQITVNYGANKTQGEIEPLILEGLKKYKKNNIYSV